MRVFDLGLVAVLVVPASWVVCHSWFYYDDFFHLQAVDRSSFGWSALTRNIFGHVMPGLVVAFEAVSLAGTASWVVAGALTIGGFGATLALTLAIGRQLGLARPIPELAAVAVAVNGAWPTTLSWFSASVNVLGSTAGSLGAVWMLLRSIRRPGWPSAVGVAASMVVAMSTLEVSVLTIPLLVVVVVFEALAGGGSVVAALRRQWRVWTALGVVLGAALIVWVTSGLSGSDGGVVMPTAGWAALRSVVEGAIPAQVGLRPPEGGWAGAGWVLVVIAAGVAVWATHWWSGRVGRLWWVLAASVVAVWLIRGAALGASRLDELGWQLTTINRHVAVGSWMVPVLAMVGLAWGSTNAGRSDEGSTDLAGKSPVRTRLLAFTAIAMGLMLGSVPAAVDEGEPFRSREYRDHFVASLARSSASSRADLAVADSTVPSFVIGPQFGSGTHLSVTLGLAGVTAGWNEPDLALLVADDTGRLAPASWGRYATGNLSDTFVAPGSGAVANQDDTAVCLVAGPDGALAWIPLDQRLTAAEWTLRVESVDAIDPAPRLAVAGVDAPRFVADQVVDRWPAGEALITGEPFAADRIGLGLAPNSTVCLRSLFVELAEPVGG